MCCRLQFACLCGVLPFIVDLAPLSDSQCVALLTDALLLLLLNRLLVVLVCQYPLNAPATVRSEYAHFQFRSSCFCSVTIKKKKIHLLFTCLSSSLSLSTHQLAAVPELLCWAPGGAHQSLAVCALIALSMCVSHLRFCAKPPDCFLSCLAFLTFSSSRYLPLSSMVAPMLSVELRSQSHFVSGCICSLFHSWQLSSEIPMKQASRIARSKPRCARTTRKWKRRCPR